MCSFLCKNLCSESFPNFDGKFIQGSDSWNKGNTGRAGDSEIELLTDPVIWDIFYSLRQSRWAFGVWCCFWRSRTQKGFRQRLRDEGARSDFRLKISFRVNPREREVHCESRNSQIGCQHTGGGDSG